MRRIPNRAPCSLDERFGSDRHSAKTANQRHERRSCTPYARTSQTYGLRPPARRGPDRTRGKEGLPCSQLPTLVIDPDDRRVRVIGDHLILRPTARARNSACELDHDLFSLTSLIAAPTVYSQKCCAVVCFKSALPFILEAPVEKLPGPASTRFTILPGVWLFDGAPRRNRAPVSRNE